MQGVNLAPKWIRTSWKMVGICKKVFFTKKALKGGDQEEQHLKHSQGKKIKNAPIPAGALPSGPDKGVKREEGQYLEKSVQHRRGAATQQQHSHWRSTTDSQNWDQSTCFPAGCT